MTLYIKCKWHSTAHLVKLHCGGYLITCRFLHWNSTCKLSLFSLSSNSSCFTPYNLLFSAPNSPKYLECPWGCKHMSQSQSAFSPSSSSPSAHLSTSRCMSPPALTEITYLQCNCWRVSQPCFLFTTTPEYLYGTDDTFSAWWAKWTQYMKVLVNSVRKRWRIMTNSF